MSLFKKTRKRFQKPRLLAGPTKTRKERRTYDHAMFQNRLMRTLMEIGVPRETADRLARSGMSFHEIQKEMKKMKKDPRLKIRNVDILEQGNQRGDRAHALHKKRAQLKRYPSF